MRYLNKYILEDLKSKMVFIGWPRQVGKTTFSKEIAENNYSKYTYLNWDNTEHKRRILNQEYDSESQLIIFDEVHKYSKWKNLIKWEYDIHKNKYDFLITWSARLDTYQKWWDSMLGRYYYYRLHPFSLAELLNIENDFSDSIELNFKDKFYNDILEELAIYGGFPEPLISKNQRTLRRWQKDRLKRIIDEDIRDITNVREIGLIEVLADILKEKVASNLSINSLVEDLQVWNKTISNWINILERVYHCYRIYPYYDSELKSLKKEPKLYLWDYSVIDDIWSKNENLIANHLLKWMHFLQDVYGYDIQLKYIKDKEKREVDFVIVVDNKIKYLIEVKTNDKTLSKHLVYYKNKLWIDHCFQVVFWNKNIDIEKSWIRVISASKFLTGLV